MKAHEDAPRAHVTKLFPEEGYGFLETLDGREIYFHRHSVLHPGFDRLEIGVEVGFAEEEGRKARRQVLWSSWVHAACELVIQ